MHAHAIMPSFHTAQAGCARANRQMALNHVGTKCVPKIASVVKGSNAAHRHLVLVFSPTAAASTATTIVFFVPGQIARPCLCFFRGTYGVVGGAPRIGSSKRYKTSRNLHGFDQGGGQTGLMNVPTGPRWTGGSGVERTMHRQTNATSFPAWRHKRPALEGTARCAWIVFLHENNVAALNTSTAATKYRAWSGATHYYNSGGLPRAIERKHSHALTSSAPCPPPYR